MKVREVVNAFKGLTEVYSSVDNFQRKWDLVPAYKEIKEVVQMHDEERNKLIKEFGNEKGQIYTDKIGLFNEKYESIISSEVKLKHKLRFTKKEVEDSKILGPELTNIMEFISE